MGVPHPPADRNKVFCTILSYLAKRTPDLCLSLNELPPGMFPAESQRILESFYGDAHVERTTELTDQVFGEGGPEGRGVWNEATQESREIALGFLGIPRGDLATRKWHELPSTVQKDLAEHERLWVPDLVERDVRGR